MSPPFYQDWWLAAALSATALPAGSAFATTPSPSPIGVVTASAQGDAGQGQVLHVIGNDVSSGQRLQTSEAGSLHILLLDQSALTLGPDSELTIDEFTYDADTRQGQIRLGLLKGAVRFVGGHISKNNAVVITTPSSTVEVTGGISLVSVRGNQTQATFLFGQQMRVSNPSGTQSVTRPGFSVTSSSQTPPSAPTQSTTEQLQAQLTQIDRSNMQPQEIRPQLAQATTHDADPFRSSNRIPPNNLQQQLAPDRVQTSAQNQVQANPNLTLSNLLSSGASTIQS